MSFYSFVIAFTDPEAASGPFRAMQSESNRFVDLSESPAEWYVVRLPDATQGGSGVLFQFVDKSDGVTTVYRVMTTLAQLAGVVDDFRAADERDALHGRDT